MNLLLNNRFFTYFTEAGARALAEYAEEISFNDQTILFEEGDPSDCFYLLTEGQIELSKKSGDGRRQVILQRVSPGDYFGEMGILDGNPRSARATSRGASRVARIPGTPLLRILNQEPARAGLHFFQNIMDNLRASNERVVEGFVRQEELKLIGEASSRIIHDLKNCLGAIRGSSELVMNAHHDSKTRENCRLIVEQTDRVVTIVHDLLEFTRSVTTLKRENIKVKDLLNQFSENHKELLNRSGFQVSIQGIETEIHVDPHRVQHVFLNLVESAMERIGGQGGVIGIRAYDVDDQVAIDVQDNGPAIPENMRGNFFKPMVMRTERKGAGLAMTVVQKLIEAHKGTVALRCDQGKGVTIQIRLPQAGAAAKV
ncbi:MAG: cyclic nucleotide-binding domain-containing protein [Verrucomicrobiae bacterium]|nr:cyclic nucleotide-binding domain-containing protein [Verrucomicrobiae bacterium]